MIFGIFVGISYTVFGDTLQPALVTLFEDSFEGISDKNNGVISRQLIDLNTVDLDVEQPNEHTSLLKNMSNKTLTLDSKGNGYGLVIPTREITTEKTFYILEFTMKLESGVVHHIGGHIGGLNGDGITEVVILIDGIPVEPSDKAVSNNDWYSGVPTPEGYSVGDSIDVQVAFYRDYFSEMDYADSPIKIQPNRNWVMANPIK